MAHLDGSVVDYLEYIEQIIISEFDEEECLQQKNFL